MEDLIMESKKFYQSKTFWFNVIALVVMVLGAFGYKGEVPEEWAALVPAILAIVNLVLRFITKQPIER
jgi:hypothetical protein